MKAFAKNKTAKIQMAQSHDLRSFRTDQVLTALTLEANPGRLAMA